MNNSLFKVLLLTTFTFSAYIASACAVDVVINQGNTITVCENAATNAISASAGYVSYTWTGPVTGTGASVTPTASGVVQVSATDNNGCVSTASITVTFVPNLNASITSSEGLNVCPTANTTTLSLPTTYTSYLWNNGTTNPTLSVSQSGSYSVIVKDANGCSDTATLSISFIEFKAEMIGGSTVCHGSNVILKASGGDVYAWSTNEFTPQITVAPLVSTNYSVTIYKGACHETFTIPVNVAALPPHKMNDTIYVFPGEPAFVSGPAGFDVYKWFPDDNLTSNASSSTSFIGSSSEDITLVATNNKVGCSITHTTHFRILDLTIPEGFSPNGDGINDFFEIPEIYNFKNVSLKVWNRWGDIVFQSDFYRNDWDGSCKGPLCAGSGIVNDGTYYYILTVEGFKYEKFLTIKK